MQHVIKSNLQHMGGKKTQQNMALFAQRHCYSIQQTDGIKIYGDFQSFFD